MIKLEKLTKTYRVGDTFLTALDTLSLQIEKGEFTAFMGASGSGKSTLLSLLGGVEKATSGEILVFDKNIGQSSDSELADWRAAQVGFIFQTFNLLPVLTAYENVEYPLTLGRMPASQRRDRVHEVLKWVGLESRLHHRPAQLSGGQRQRVAIARALAASPSLILADEPTANLDHATGLEILSLLKDLNAKTNTTILFSTHDTKIVSQARRVITLEDGRLIQDVPCT